MTVPMMAELTVLLSSILLAAWGSPSIAGDVHRPENPPAVVTRQFFSRQFNALHALTITHLDLSGHNISRVTPDAFCDLTSLVKIDLSSNALESLHRDTFVCNKALKKLVLSDNPRLNSVPGEAFLRSDSLYYLDLSYCNFTDASPYPFGLMGNLTSVNLRGNPACEALRDGMVRGFPGISYSDCQVTKGGRQRAKLTSRPTGPSSSLEPTASGAENSDSSAGTSPAVDGTPPGPTTFQQDLNTDSTVGISDVALSAIVLVGIAVLLVVIAGLLVVIIIQLYLGLKQLSALVDCCRCRSDTSELNTSSGETKPLKGTQGLDVLPVVRKRPANGQAES